MYKKSHKPVLLACTMMLLCINTFAFEVEFNQLDDTIKQFDKLLKQKWVVKLTKPQYGHPIVRNGFVFAPEERKFAIDLSNGEKLFFKNSKHQEILKSKCPDSLIYFYNDNLSYLIDIYHGEEKVFRNKPFSWRYDIRELFIKDSILIQIFEDQYLEAKLLENIWEREIIWQKKMKSRIRGYIITNDSLAFVSDFNFIYILNKRTGKELWKKEAKRGALSPLYVKGSLMYAFVENDSITKELWCVDIKNLKLNWSYRFPSTGLTHSMFTDKSHIYFIGDSGVYKITNYKGEFVSLFKGNYIPWYISEISDCIIVYDRDIGQTIAYDGEIITAIDKKSGKVTFQFFTSEGFPYEPPKFTEEELKRYSMDGSLSDFVKLMTWITEFFLL